MSVDAIGASHANIVNTLEAWSRLGGFNELQRHCIALPKKDPFVTKFEEIVLIPQSQLDAKNHRQLSTREVLRCTEEYLKQLFKLEPASFFRVAHSISSSLNRITEIELSEKRAQLILVVLKVALKVLFCAIGIVTVLFAYHAIKNIRAQMVHYKTSKENIEKTVASLHESTKQISQLCKNAEEYRLQGGSVAPFFMDLMTMSLEDAVKQIKRDHNDTTIVCAVDDDYCSPVSQEELKDFFLKRNLFKNGPQFYHNLITLHHQGTISKAAEFNSALCERIFNPNGSSPGVVLQMPLPYGRVHIAIRINTQKQELVGNLILACQYCDESERDPKGYLITLVQQRLPLDLMQTPVQQLSRERFNDLNSEYSFRTAWYTDTTSMKEAFDSQWNTLSRPKMSLS